VPHPLVDIFFLLPKAESFTLNHALCYALIHTVVLLIDLDQSTAV
jgi:hypothetical protein